MSGLLHTVLLQREGWDWPDAVFVGSQDECGRFVSGKLVFDVESLNDESVFYVVVPVVDHKESIQHIREIHAEEGAI